VVCYDDRNEINCPNPGEAFFGQDAQVEGNQPSYTVNRDGLTVYDNVTGLTWTQSPDLNGDGEIDVEDKITFAEAQDYADTTLNPQSYGGYNDWRLPTIKELYSLMDFSGTDPSSPNPRNLMPFIDTNTFDFAYGDESAGERLIDAQFWTSNEYVGRVFSNQPAAHLQHHDVEMLPNGNVLLIAWQLKSRPEAIAVGRNPSLLPDGEL
jgi:hypothetical protein